MQLSKLRWKCRKGIMELDILLAKYLEHNCVNLSQKNQDIFIEFTNIDTYQLFDIIFNKKSHNSKFIKIIRDLTSIAVRRKNEYKN